MLNQKTDWVIWKRNPPTAVVWMKNHWTLFAEVKTIFNSKPLVFVVETINDVNSEVALSPSHLLTMKSKVVMPPPHAFGKPDLYCRRHWRRVQHICNKFWNRWRKEFLATLQERQKWLVSRRNFYIEDMLHCWKWMLIAMNGNWQKWSTFTQMRKDM